jgi:hypothetical protein
MANSPNPEYLSEVMFEDFGTRVLITDPAADAYLRASKAKKDSIKEKYSQWCGGVGGFDDYTERWHLESGTK